VSTVTFREAAELCNLRGAYNGGHLVLLSFTALLWRGERCQPLCQRMRWGEVASGTLDLVVVAKATKTGETVRVGGGRAKRDSDSTGLRGHGVACNHM
jgi:hypothetical protein